jgi:lipopolysaccharide transport system permease protein
MQRFPSAPNEVMASLWRNRELIKALAKREVIGRYRGSMLGLLWSFFNPLLMLAVYTFVFSVIFQSRWGGNGGSGSKIEFAMVLFTGLIVFNLFSECIGRAPSLILSNPNYVKKVVFPLEILPFVSLLASAYHALISLAVWLIAYVIFFGAPPATVIYLPLIIFPFTLFIMGWSWLLASLGVFLRDVGQFVGVVIPVLMFLSPIFYATESLPPAYRNLLYLNPIAVVVEMVRDVMYWGKAPEWSVLAVHASVMVLIAWMGFAWFQKTRKGFADVL